MSSINNPDLKNTDPDYWEMILKNHNLSMDRGLPRASEGALIYAGLLGLQTAVVDLGDDVAILDITNGEQ